jgi:hypothetical protein
MPFQSLRRNPSRFPPVQLSDLPAFPSSENREGLWVYQNWVIMIEAVEKPAVILFPFYFSSLCALMSRLALFYLD